MDLKVESPIRKEVGQAIGERAGGSPAGLIRKGAD
jgi:hypothetical protein